MKYTITTLALTCLLLLPSCSSTVQNDAFDVAAAVMFSDTPEEQEAVAVMMTPTAKPSRSIRLAPLPQGGVR